MNFRGIGCAAVLALGLLLSACGGSKGSDNGLPAQNVAPVANAGSTQSVYTASTVTLDGSASTDANADSLTYTWAFISKPAGSNAALSSTTAVKPTFVADVAGNYVLSLVVNDGKADSSNTATVTITASVLNLAPVANAGPAQNVYTNTLVNLTGAASTDGNGDTLTYAWTLTAKPAGSTAALANATTVAPSFTADLAGSYTVSLIVNDGQVNSSAATVTITASILNVAPVANAGTAQNVTTTSTVTLDGSASSDANGDTLVYTWSLTTKPVGSSAVLSSSSAIKPTFTADLAGSYVAQLIVYDGTVTSSPATVTITAAVANVAPVANAGTAQSVTAGDTVTLDGSGSSDANGDTLTYAWVLSSKPGGSTATLSSATAQKPSFVADVAGSYVAQLVVNDGKVNSSNAANVTVTAASLVVPAANTGLLNDTGITSMGNDASGNYLATCSGAAAGNDCNTGRDATANDDADGHAGFSFTKIAADGTALPASATSWSCVKDNVTGLIWENKTAANGGATYTNYGDGRAGDASAYATSVNAAGLCGASDWRLPTRRELMSLVDYSVAYPGPTIDTAWFPNTQQNAFWSSSPSAGYSGYAWYVYFYDGFVGSNYRGRNYAVRLVRSGQ